MIAAGMGPEALLAAVEDMELALSKPSPKTDAERSKSYRERHASRDYVTETPIKEIPPTPPKENIYISPPNTRAKGIPANWTPTPENLSWAKAKGYPPDFVARETERHQLWAESRGVARKSWSRSWQGWLMRSWTEQHLSGSDPPNPMQAAIERVKTKARETENAERSGEIVEFAPRRS
jgi:hypothetical protein